MEADEYYESIDLHIRWSDRQDLILRVSPEETIYTIKEKVMTSICSCSGLNRFLF
jgi:hypothetical protein